LYPQLSPDRQLALMNFSIEAGILLRGTAFTKP
jgi:hypothetical protein